MQCGHGGTANIHWRLEIRSAVQALPLPASQPASQPAIEWRVHSWVTVHISYFGDGEAFGSKFITLSVAALLMFQGTDFALSSEIPSLLLLLSSLSSSFWLWIDELIAKKKDEQPPEGNRGLPTHEISPQCRNFRVSNDHNLLL
jgi:hypothetical protein